MIRGYKSGDTIIEVMFAFSVFSMVAIIGMSLMNLGIKTGQTALELTMARNEITVQSEALRFIHNSYVSETNLDASNQQYTELWNALIDTLLETDSEDIPPLVSAANTCIIPESKVFIINPRRMDGSSSSPTSGESNLVIGTNDTDSILRPAPLYSRLIFNENNDTNFIDDTLGNILNSRLTSAEGIWVKLFSAPDTIAETSPFFDFHIRACWFAPGKNIPTTIGTIVRLYNPKYKHDWSVSP